MTRAGKRDLREGSGGPGLRGVGHYCILDAMHGRVEVVTTFKPRRKLRILAAATQVDHQIPCDGYGASLIDPRILVSAEFAARLSSSNTHRGSGESFFNCRDTGKALVQYQFRPGFDFLWTPHPSRAVC